MGKRANTAGPAKALQCFLQHGKRLLALRGFAALSSAA
jgi:hypothetical protein